MSMFGAVASGEMRPHLPDPSHRATFERCKLDWSELDRNQPIHALTADLLRLRREDPVFASQRPVEGAVLGAQAFVLRYFGGPDGDRLLIVNLGMDLRFAPAPEPLLAPVEGEGWRLLWSSEAPRYGGVGTPPLDPAREWMLPGRTALVFT